MREICQTLRNQWEVNMFSLCPPSAWWMTISEAGSAVIAVIAVIARGSSSSPCLPSAAYKGSSDHCGFLSPVLWGLTLFFILPWDVCCINETSFSVTSYFSSLMSHAYLNISFGGHNVPLPQCWDHSWTSRVQAPQ